MLIAGLGNPGKKYEGTRHNIGFDVVAKIADEYNFSGWLKKFNGLYTEGDIAGHKVRLLMPQTFMNLSGASVIECMNFYKVKLNDIVVVHDELDLPLGKLRMKTGGSDGGHNGLRSIDASCGVDYKRMRVGIGHPGNKDMVTSYVLGKFNNPEQPIVEQIVDIISKYAGVLAEGKSDLFATKFATDTAKIKELQEPKEAINE